MRAYLMGAEGVVMETRHFDWGIMNLPQPVAVASDLPGSQRRLDAFEAAFDNACGDWMAENPALPVIACGMVGSAQGWKEASYLSTPTTLDALARRLTVVMRSGKTPIHIVAGLMQQTVLPNVMRGEETQVLGVLNGAPSDGDEWLIGLPGTHSKWVRVRAAQITGFDTFMTGEMFAALCQHTILGRTMQVAAQPDDAAFARGVQVARSADARLGLLSNIFSTRTLGLTGALAAQAQADYLSGLLIGHEVAALASCREDIQRVPIVLCGESDLCRRYAMALELIGLSRPQIAGPATPTGLWRVAVAAGLVSQGVPGRAKT